MSSPHIKLRLGQQDHEAWLQLADKLDQRPSTLARIVIREALDQLAKDRSARERLQRDPFQTAVFARLNTAELELLDRFADELGLTRSRTVAALIRGVLAQSPQFSSRERQALLQSNAQLRAVGFNLNQVAKAMNAIKRLVATKLEPALTSEGEAKLLALELKAHFSLLDEKMKELTQQLDGKTLKQPIDEHLTHVYDLVHEAKRRLPQLMKAEDAHES